MSELIYTVTFGEIEVCELVNETSKGFRVKYGRWNHEKVVFNLKQYAGWFTSEEKIYFQQRAFTKKAQAETFAMKQLLSMEGYYIDKLKAINDVKSQLDKQA